MCMNFRLIPIWPDLFDSVAFQTNRRVGPLQDTAHVEKCFRPIALSVRHSRLVSEELNAMVPCRELNVSAGL